MRSTKTLATVAGRCGARQKQHWDRASQEGKFGISAVGNGEHGGGAWLDGVVLEEESSRPVEMETQKGVWQETEESL